MTDLPSAALKQVVLNDEGQYSLWPANQVPPEGWHPEGFVASEEEALGHIAKVWTDMRPRSARLASFKREQN